MKKFKLNGNFLWNGEQVEFHTKSNVTYRDDLTKLFQKGGLPMDVKVLLAPEYTKPSAEINELLKQNVR